MRQLTAEEELARIVSGKKVPISPDMDHEAFIELAQSILDNDDAAAMYSDANVEAIQAQMAQHEALVEAMNAQSKQAAQANQQMTNQMGVAGGIQPGQAPFSNPYNDFQASRSSLMNEAAGPGGMLPGMQKPNPGQAGDME
jgi:hypothetical protein